MDVIRAETIGSMLRPAELRAARRSYRRGEITASEFKRIEDSAVDAAIALQERCGIQVVTDGEQRRASFLGALLEATEGLSRSDEVLKPWHEQDGSVSRLSLGLMVTQKVRRVRSLVAEEYAYARARAQVPVKVSLPSPMMLSMFYSPRISGAVYRDPFELFADGAAVIRAEIAELARQGCAYIQIDAPELATLTDPVATREMYEQNGIDSHRLLHEGLEILNSLASTPGVIFGLHLCRGNNDGRWLAQGGYDAIAQEMFRRATNYSRILLEYDDARSGGFAPLAAAPRDKTIVLGLVTTKTSRMETADELARRIDEAARYFPREHLGLSPQCGFASGVGGNPLTGEIQEAKLKLVANVARRVWGA